MQRILAENHAAPHVNSIKLGLASFDKTTGEQTFDQDELLRLADIEQYAPAQFVVAQLYNHNVKGILSCGGPFLLYEGHVRNPFPKDATKFQHYLHAAADQDFLPALTPMGVLLLKSDRRRAVDYLQKAMDRGDSSAAFVLSTLKQDDGDDSLRPSSKEATRRIRE
jgi:hypothetical protein